MKVPQNKFTVIKKKKVKQLVLRLVLVKIDGKIKLHGSGVEAWRAQRGLKTREPSTITQVLMELIEQEKREKGE